VGDVTTLDPARFADLLVGYCLEIERNDEVLVRSTTGAEPLLLELQRAILQRGAWPLLRIELPGQARDYFLYAEGLQLDDVSDIMLREAKSAEKHLTIQAPHDTNALVGIDPERMTRLRRARQPIQAAAMGKTWCSSLWPTQALADQAGMELDAFTAFVAGAMFLTNPEPVTAWASLRRFQETLITRLSEAKKLRLEAPGTDLTLSVKNRKWVNSDGRRNMPSGEVFTGPHETSADGTVAFTVRSSPPGLEIDGVTLTFRDGVVVDAKADVGQEQLDAALGTDDGARRLGEIGIGTNYGIDRAIGVILFDEKIGGTVHLALGRSYPETGGKNVSALHWDLICDLRDGGRLTADGEVVQENGRFA
jgi:aminopeptidase